MSNQNNIVDPRYYVQHNEDERGYNVVERIKELQNFQTRYVSDEEIQAQELESTLSSRDNELSKEYLRVDKANTPGGAVLLGAGGKISEEYLPPSSGGTGIAEISLAGTLATVVGSRAEIPLTSDTCAGLLSCENKAKLDSIDTETIATKQEVLTVESEIPTKTSELTNDSGFLTQHQSLEAYATKQEVSVVESEIPTKTSDLTNDSGFLTQHQSLEAYATKQEVSTVESEIPTKTSELTNDSGFLTSHQSLAGYATEQWVESKNYLTQHQSLEAYATKQEVSAVEGEIPTKTSELTNDSGFLTTHQSLEGYATEQWVDNKNYASQSSVDEISMEREPKWDAAANTLFANGTPITISDTGTANLVTYYGKDSKAGSPLTMEIPYNAIVFGGGDGRVKGQYYGASEIIINGGRLQRVYGGPHGAGSVGSSTIIMNDGTVSKGVHGGGQRGNSLPHSNSTGCARVVLNGGTCTQVLSAGGVDKVGVGNSTVDINGGSVGYLYGSGSNGTVGITEMNINDGTINWALGIVRGSVENVTWNINGGTINKIWAGADDDTAEDGTIHKVILNALGGTITELHKGYSGLVEGNFECSGEYVEGVITNQTQAVEECDLVFRDNSEKLDEDITVSSTVGNIPAGTVFPAGTPIMSILTQMLSSNPTPPVVGDYIYYGMTDNVPSLSSLNNPGSTDTVVKNEVSTPQSSYSHAYNNGEAEDVQYFSFAYPTSLGNLVSILDEIQADELSQFTKITDNGYNIYYKPNCWTEEDYTLEFKF